MEETWDQVVQKFEKIENLSSNVLPQEFQEIYHPVPIKQKTESLFTSSRHFSVSLEWKQYLVYFSSLYLLWMILVLYFRPSIFYLENENQSKQFQWKRFLLIGTISFIFFASTAILLAWILKKFWI